MSDRDLHSDQGGVFSRAVVAYAGFVIDRKLIVIAATILMCLGMIFGGSRLSFTNDYRYFFSDENPNLAAFEQIQRTYTSPDTLLWVLKPDEGTATNPRMLELIRSVTEEAWQTPFTLRVDSITNFQHTTADGDDLTVRDLVAKAGDISDAAAEDARRVAMSEPSTALRLISADGKTTAVVATLKMPTDDNVALNETMRFARDLQARIMAENPDVHVALTGSVALSNAFSEAAFSDLSTLTPAMYGALALVIFLLTRSLSGTLASLIVVAFSAIAALGVAGWLGIRLSPPSSAAPTVILTVAVADSIHILISALVQMRKGTSKREAIIESLRINWTPVFLTSVTTAIGFLSLNFADAPPFHDLGNISAIGCMIAWALSISLLPALLALLPVKAHRIVESQSMAMGGFADWVIRYRTLLLTGMTLLVIGGAALIPSLHFNDRFVEYFDNRVQFRVDSDFAADNLTGIYVVHYSIGAGEAQGISDPAYLDALDRFALWLREQPEVVHVSSFTDVMKRLNKSLHGDDPRYYRVPGNREETAQYLLLFEFSLPYGLDLNDMINVDKSATRLTVTLNDIDTAELLALEERAAAWQAENIPAHMQARPAGQFKMFAYISENNFNQMRLGTLIALLLISACLVLALRSFKLGAFSLVPNIAPPVVAFGLYAIFSSELGFWATFTVSTALGLIVDATVHFLSKYQRGQKELGLDAEGAVRHAFANVGTALWVSTVVLIAGFALLAFSFFKVNAMLGLLVAVIIAVALVLDFLLLPALLIAIDRGKPKLAPNVTKTDPATTQ